MKSRVLSALFLVFVAAACADAADALSPVRAGPIGAGGGSGSGGAAGSGGGSGGGQAGSQGLGPTIRATSFVGSPTAPLAGSLLVAVDRPATIRVAIDDGAGHELTLAPSSAPNTVHSIPVLQLRPARTYTMTVIATDEAGRESEPTIVFRPTSPLPTDFPPIEIVTAAKGDGLTLFPVSRFAQDGTVDGSWGYIVAVDSTGQVVWYGQTGTTLDDLRIDSAGQLRFVVGNGGLVAATVLGEGTSAWLPTGFATPNPLPSGAVVVKTDTIHHDAIELPNGHILALGTTSKKITKATCATYDKDYDVVGDLVLEIEPKTGTVVSTVSMFDLLDPCRRVDASFKGTFWATLYGPDSADWTHSNGLAYDAARNAILVSSRHQDWVVAYRATDDAGGKAGSLLFKLGPEGDFALAGQGAAWPYHQHSPKVLPNGNIMVFDNGTSRPGTKDSDITKLPASRGVELALDMSGPKGAWTATQVWQYGPDEVRTVDTSTGAPVNVPYYSSVIGNSEMTPQGTVLLTEGALTDPANGSVFLASVKKSARIVEVTRDPSASVVMDLRVRDPAATEFWSYIVFRATRVPSLYPASAKAVVASH